jgi:hypothetical protein
MIVNMLSIPQGLLKLTLKPHRNRLDEYCLSTRSN